MYNLLKRQFEYIKSLIVVILCCIKNCLQNNRHFYLTDCSSSSVFDEVGVNMLARDTFMERLVWGSWVCFQNNFLPAMGLEQPVSRDPHMDLSAKLFDHPYNMSVGFPKASVPRQSKEEVTGLLQCSLQRHTHHFHHSLFLRSESLSSSHTQEEGN